MKLFPAVGSKGSNSVYIFDVNRGEQLQRLTVSDAINFGNSLAVSGDKLIVGAHGHFHVKGAVYIFDINSGELLQRLTELDGVKGNWFGITIATSGDKLIVAAPRYRKVYIYNVNNGQLLQKLLLMALIGIALVAH